LRYRLHDRSLPGAPDIVFKSALVAVQVRGCFWHSHSCKIGHIPKSRTEFWANKLQRNVHRDEKNDQLLTGEGWKVIVVWECEVLSQGTLARRVAHIEKLVRKRDQRATTQKTRNRGELDSGVSI
jgi:G:T-mismatch repair DNA endonuclease (very short patch repair protein)